MTIYIALLRGINIGSNRIKMNDIKSICSSFNCTNITTYIQTGNIIFEHKTTSRNYLSNELSSRIEKSHGFKPKVMILLETELNEAYINNPYPKAELKRLHFYFLEEIPKLPEYELLDKIKTKDEEYTLLNQVFYLHTLNGLRNSKIAPKLEKILKVSGTARNLRTVSKIKDIVESYNIKKNEEKEDEEEEDK